LGGAAMDAAELDRLRDHYRFLTDEELAVDHARGPRGYRDEAVWQMIREEVIARGLTAAEKAFATSVEELPLATRAILGEAAAQMRDGIPLPEIESYLREQGLEAESATRILTVLAAALRESGRKKMTSGAMWCAGGLALTVMDYLHAAPGGTFVIALGPIAFGAFRFLQGMALAKVSGPSGSGLPSPVGLADAAELPPEPDAARQGNDEPRQGSSIWKIIVVLVIVYVISRVMWFVVHASG
jgi:hypothetical protein